MRPEKSRFIVDSRLTQEYPQKDEGEHWKFFEETDDFHLGGERQAGAIRPRVEGRTLKSNGRKRHFGSRGQETQRAHWT